MRVETREAAKSISDLRENIKYYKKEVENAEVGSAKFNLAQKKLAENQNALKDAMNSSKQSMAELTASAKGTSESYNSLVHRMAEMKKQLRSIDISTKEGEEAFRSLAGQINGVNDQLKQLDGLQGNFQRNVGNYDNSFKGWAGSVDSLDKAFKSTQGGLGGVKGGLEAIAASPAIGTFGILVSVAVRIGEALKEDENATASIKKLMESMKPVMDFFSGVLSKISDILVDLVGHVSEFVNSNGLFQRIANGLAGVGNAILQFVVAPFKGVIEAIKVFKEEGIKGIGDAARAFGQEMKGGVAFKANFNAGQEATASIIAGARSKKAEVEKTGEEIGETLSEGITKGLAKVGDGWQDKMDSVLAAKLEAEKLAAKEMEDLNALLKAQADEANDYADAVVGEILAKMEEADKKNEELAKNRIMTLSALASNTSSILGSIADMYENDAENSEKSANKIKALRVAAATIDTISGAIGAFMQASETIPPPYGAIIGGVEAAAITASGMAQIAQMQGTRVSADATSSAPRVTTSALVSAPSVNMDIPSVRSVTSASEEDRLNYMARDQKVVLITSELEMKQGQQRVQVQETSW